tara:strand:- start:61 stop:378 length:318 start_codon:yes stop_codon:yes gene_type:complete
MVLFDTVNAEAYRDKLPDCPKGLNLSECQTEDLDCFQCLYTITDFGEIYSETDTDLPLQNGTWAFTISAWDKRKVRTGGFQWEEHEWMLIAKDRHIIAVYKLGEN